MGTYCQDSLQVRPCKLERDSAQAALSTVAGLTLSLSLTVLTVGIHPQLLQP